MKRTEEQWRAHKFKLENRGSSSLQSYVLKRLKEQPHIKVNKIVKANEDGVSDLILCVEGKYVAIELKTNNNKTTKLQDLFLESVREAGGIAETAYTWGEVVEIIEKAGSHIVPF